MQLLAPCYITRSFTDYIQSLVNILNNDDDDELCRQQHYQQLVLVTLMIASQYMLHDNSNWHGLRSTPGLVRLSVRQNY